MLYIYIRYALRWWMVLRPAKARMHLLRVHTNYNAEYTEIWVCYLNDRATNRLESRQKAKSQHLVCAEVSDFVIFPDKNQISQENHSRKRRRIKAVIIYSVP